MDGQGKTNPLFLFIINGALTTEANSIIQLTGGVNACNVWWLPSAATLGANSTFIGNIWLQKSAITVGENVQVKGRLFSGGANGTISTHNDTINPC